MNSLQKYMAEYKKQMEKGDIIKAYSGLMQYIMDLRNHLQKKYPNYNASGSIYLGYMDMTYFSFFPESLKKKKLKAGIVFIHKNCRFEIWLFGYNKKVQDEYIKKFKESKWDKYKIVPTSKGYDSIIEHILDNNPDFSNLDKLTEKIENGTMQFIKDVEQQLYKL